MSLRLWWKNRKLRKSRQALEKQYNDAAKDAKRKKSHDILDEWYSVNGWEFDSIDAEIKHNDSRDLLDEAESLYLPTPERSDETKWISKDDLNSFENWSVLTPEAMTDLRTSIRKERRERRETVDSWAKIIGTIITICTGLVGAIIGLVAVLKK
jgi:5-formyltetrahydrofolate cyclo-ligase